MTTTISKSVIGQPWPTGAPPGTPLARVHEQIVACTRCPRLRAWCELVSREKKAAHRDETYWGRPVPGFGDPDAQVLVLGLAPAAHGANRTGRVFTGDGSGDFLMRAMHEEGFASIPTSRLVGDGLELNGAYILAAVRCAPPDNKPDPTEIANCASHLAAEIAALPRVRVVVALGRIAADAYWRWAATRAAVPRPRPPFAHGAVIDSGPALPLLVQSYHPSRQNTNTGKLTPEMLRGVFATARDLLPTQAGAARAVHPEGRGCLTRRAEASASALAAGPRVPAAPADDRHD